MKPLVSPGDVEALEGQAQVMISRRSFEWLCEIAREYEKGELEATAEVQKLVNRICASLGYHHTHGRDANTLVELLERQEKHRQLCVDEVSRLAGLESSLRADLAAARRERDEAIACARGEG